MISEHLCFDDNRENKKCASILLESLLQHCIFIGVFCILLFISADCSGSLISSFHYVFESYFTSAFLFLTLHVVITCI
jgi:hypothetical protein